MKPLFFFLSLSCFLILSVIAETINNISCEEITDKGHCSLFGVSIIELLANPQKYNGKKIRVSGYLHIEDENTGIYLHKEDLVHSLYANGLWIVFLENTFNAECRDKYAVVEGIFDSKNTGHLGLWKGAINITRCTPLPGNHLPISSSSKLKLKNAKVATELQAKNLAFNEYINIMLKSKGISATESAAKATIETVGFDMPKYAKNGDAVWEVRIIDMVSGLKAIAWVHSETQAVKFLLLP